MSDIDVNGVVKMGQDYEAAKQATIKQLLDRQKETAEQLKVLGYTGKAVKAAKAASTKKPCSKCSSTEHDARFHRGEKKRAEA
jgi:hypothetical protein